MFRLHLTLLSFFLVSGNTIFAQILQVSPLFPNADDTVTIIYDATQGNGDLTGIIPVYAHTGVITSESPTETSWQYVQGNWGTNDPNVLMTPLGGNLHEIKYHVRDFYGVPEGIDILKMAFVFRNGDGSLVGRNSDGSDIYYCMNTDELAVSFLAPDENIIITIAGLSLPIVAAANDSVELKLYDNGTLLTSIVDNQIEYTLTTEVGVHVIAVTAEDGDLFAADTFSYAVNPPITFESLPEGTLHGINYINDSTIRLAIYAPGKQYIYVFGDFNNWFLNTDYYMKKTPDTEVFWLDITGLTPGEQYAFQYMIDGEMLVADPYSEVILDPFDDPFIDEETYPGLPDYPTGKASGAATIVQPGKPAYEWQTTDFTAPARTDLVIYELLVRDFIEAHNYKTLLDTLDYLERLGINAIQFMPVNEFEGNISWGYNPSFHMALDKYYGTIDDFKHLIDEIHARGMAVILDVVYNHAFSQSPLNRMYWDDANFRPSPDNPWLNPEPRHPFNVGDDFNHESPHTKAFIKRVMKYWIEEFKVDGFRFDLSKGFTQNFNTDVGLWGNYDASRIAIIKEYADANWEVNPNFYNILEHFSDNSEETELANYGLMFWGNGVFDYTESAIGFSSNLSWYSYDNRGWSEPNLVSYMESHDEERMVYKSLTFGNSSGSYNIKSLPTALDRVELAAAFLLNVPGPKMIWQFGELGYDISIDEPCRVCPKPILWEYYEEDDRRDLYDAFSDMIHLRTSYEPFRTTDFNYSLNGSLKRIRLNHSEFNVVVIGNFGVVENNITPGFQETGWWYDYMDGDSLFVTSTDLIFSLDAGEYHIYTSTKLREPEIPAGIFDTPQSDMIVRLYPNPASDHANIYFELEQAAETVIQIDEISGKRIANMDLGWLPSGAQQIQWDIPGSGQYIVRIISGNKQTTRKLISIN